MSDKTHSGGHGHAHAHGDHGHGHGPGGHDHHEEHVHPREHYVKVWAALLVLFAISVIGPIAEIKLLTLITAFGVAVVKASMVVKYFMHLDVEKRFVHYFLAISLAFMFLFFAGVAPDVMKHEGTNWRNVAAIETSARIEAEAAAGGGGHGDAGHGAAGDAGHGDAGHGDAAEPGKAPAAGGH